MKKQLRNIIISLCVVVVLVVGVVVANIIINKQPDDTSSSSSSDSSSTIPVLDIKSEDVTEINVKNSKGEFTIKQSNKVCSIDGIEASLLNTDSCSQTIVKVAQLSASTEIEKNATDLAQYGLDNPVRTVVIKTASGSNTLYVGNDTPSKDGVYVMVNDSKDVYKVDSTLTTNLDNTELDFVKLNIYSIDSDKTDNVTKIELGGSARKTPLVLEHEAGTSDDSQSSGFLLTSPATYSIDAQTSSGILTDLSSLTAADVISVDVSDSSLEKYGLNDPDYTVKITNDGQIDQFLIGKAFKEDDQTYIPLMLKGVHAIYKYADKDDAFYKYELKDLCTTLLFTEFIEKVDSIDINIGGKDHTFAITGTGDELAGTLDGNKISEDNTRRLYAKIIAIPFEGQSDSEPTTTDPTATIKVSYRDASQNDTTMEFYPMGDRKSYWVFNGRCDFYILNENLDNLQDAITQVLDGKDLPET